MSDHRRVGVGALLLLIGAAVLTPTLPTSEASGQTTARIDLEAQTLFIDNDPAEIVLRVSGAPDNARLRFTIYDDPALTRAQVRDHHSTPPTSGSQIANFECTLDGDCRGQALMTAGPDGIHTVTLDDEVIGEALREHQGALPFVVRLIDRDDTLLDDTVLDDTVLDELVTSLIVLEDESPTAVGQQRVSIGFTSQVIVPVAHQSDLRTVLDTETMQSALTSLRTHPDLPVTTEIQPETLDALAATDPDALAETLELINGRPLLRGPWIDMDEEAWRQAGESDQVVSQYARGNDTFEEIVGVPPTGLIRLDPDAGPDTLSLLRSAGATAVLVTDDQLTAQTVDASPNQPFQLVDSNGVAITALRYDESLHDTLAGDDPELAAYQAITELTLLAEESTADQMVLLDLDRLDAEPLVRMLDGIDDRRSLRLDDVTNLAEQELARTDAETERGETLRGELVSSSVVDVTGLATDLESAVAGVATIARMFEPELDFLGPLVDQLQATISTDLTAEEADEYVARVNEEVADLRTGVVISDGDRITLTDRRTDLPLTIVNGQGLPLNVELLLTAEKIRFPEGDRLTLTLDPGENVFTIPVETLASGDARVTATVVSPGGFFELGSGTVDIRSTAISGLGLIISIVALVVLAVWWIRTILRVRRQRVAATVAAASTETESVDGDTPTEGET